MAKFEEVYEDTQQLFDNHIETIDSLREVQIKILGNKKLKEIGKVVKANDLLKHLAGEDVVIMINEKVFEQLEEEQKLMVVEELVAEIYFNAENGRLTLAKPDFNTFSLFLRKFGYEKIEVLRESVKSLFSNGEAEDAENGQ